MEISSVRVIRYDFYRDGQYDQVDSSLQENFETRTEVDTQMLDFGGTEIETESILYTNASDQIQHDSFESIRTFLITDPLPEYFCHTLTIGTLTSAEQTEMDVGDPMGNRTRRENWVDDLESIASEFCSSRIQPDGPAPVSILVEPTQESLTGDLWESFNPENPLAVSGIFNGNGGTLQAYGFKPTGQISAIEPSYLLTFEEHQVADFPLAVLVTRDQSQPDAENSIEYWKRWIGFSYTRIKAITSLLLVSHWLEWRRQEISDIDDELYEYNLPNSNSGDSEHTLRDEEQDLEQLRRDWVESQSATADEFHEIEQLVEHYQREDNATIFDFPAGQETTRSYCYTYVGQLKTELQTLSETLDRVKTKLEMFISVVQDRIQSNATKSNLQLQNKVKNLTILLAVIAIIEFGLRFLPDGFWQTLIRFLQLVVEFAAQSATALFGVIAITVGFILGYTHGWLRRCI